MYRYRFFAAVTAGSLLAAAAAYAAPPVQNVSAQGRAEQACRSHEVRPASAAWELCLSHVTRAYEWNEPALAQQLAKTAGTAREACLDQGFDAASSGYRTCVDRELDARSQLLILGDDQSGENVAQSQ
ncbi:MAG: hypothetical protein JOY81_08785 [Alphaproteobacteria bacterium]|nr:hypothetical protein [Alphaproteobacteria bacterium]